VLETMSGVHIESASVTIPLLGTSDVNDILASGQFARRIQVAVSTFVAEVRRRSSKLTG
jgi:hypothetical protein